MIGGSPKAAGSWDLVSIAASITFRFAALVGVPPPAPSTQFTLHIWKRLGRLLVIQARQLLHRKSTAEGPANPAPLLFRLDDRHARARLGGLR